MNNTEILNAVAQAISDATFKKRTKPTMLGIITDAQNYVVERTECLRKSDSSTVLTADSAEITLPTDFIKLPTEGGDTKRGFVSVGTNGKFPLTLIQLPRLNNLYPGWRGTAAGTPEFCYITKDGTPKLNVWPKPSTAFLAANGNTVYLDDFVYRPPSMLEDLLLPFNGSTLLSGIFQVTLKQRAIWQVKLEDTQLAEADRLDLKVESLIEKCIDFVNTIFVTPGTNGFEEEHS